MTRPLIVFLALLGGCTTTDSADVQLRQFYDCDALQRHMTEMARDEVRESWSRGFGWGGVVPRAGDMDMAEDGGAGQWSTTNLQEAGVDEADLVKTDGTWLYVAAGGQLVVSRGWPVDQAEQVGRLDVDGHPSGLYLLEEQDLVVVVGNLWWETPRPRSGADATWQDRATTVVSLVDVSDPRSPTLLREVYTTGELRQSRRVGSKLFLVTYEDVDVTTYASTRAEARRQVREATVGDVQPLRLDNRLEREGGWTVEAGPACACQDTWGSERRGGTYLTNVMVLDLDDPDAEATGTAVVGQAHTVYATPEALYVGYSDWRSGPFGIDGELDTILHRFDITGEVPAYRATARVDGVLTDPFAISEHEGVLRIATTDMDRLESAVATLDIDESGFTPLDRVAGLAPGESITAARFLGTRGYVSTAVFVTDPLFSFDLSDPANIVQGGALEISGFSDYLHPLGDDHLIAVGADLGAQGWLQLQVSVYDVGDLRAPKLTDREMIRAWSSEAQNDHHAFNYFEPTQSLTMPSWSEDETSGLEVLHVDTEGVESIGRLRQAADIGHPDQRWCAGVRRSVIMDDVVWAVGSAGLTAARLDTPRTRIASVSFDGIDPCEDQDYGGWAWGWGWAE